MFKQQIAEANAILGAEEYSAKLIPAFTHTPPTKVDVKFAAARATLTRVVAALGGKKSIQAGGTYREESARQRLLREALNERLGQIKFTVATISEENRDPSILARFRSPATGSDNDLAARTRAVATAITQLGLTEEFASHGYGDDLPGDLIDLVHEFELSEGGQASTLGDQAGATAAIPVLLREGKTAMKILTSIFSQVYKGDIETLTAWDTASHIEKTYSRPVPPPKPPLA